MYFGFQAWPIPLLRVRMLTVGRRRVQRARQAAKVAQVAVGTVLTLG